MEAVRVEELPDENRSPFNGVMGVTLFDDRFYMVDAENDKVYVYKYHEQLDWWHDQSKDFNLDSNNGDPSGITYANGLFYVVDSVDDKVYAYDSSSELISEFNLDSNNSDPSGIAYANNRLYVVDGDDDTIYDYEPPPDLIVESPLVSNSTLTAGQSFTLRATVRNQGFARTAATATLRYYRSTNTIISMRDTLVGTDLVGRLNGAETSAESISLQAPSTQGEYYYGACVDEVRDESNTDNNCSDAVRVVVSGNNQIKDWDALVSLYENTNPGLTNPNERGWTNSLNWRSNNPLADWYGVSTNALGCVDSLNLSDNLLKGTIPEELGSLTYLTYLDLRRNQLSGAIPSSLGNLTKLQILALHENLLTGSIPAALGNLTNLTYLTLHQNRLTGSIPAALGNLTNLTAELNLSRNQLTGTIPDSLGNLTKLTELYLHDNQLSGSIPEALGNLTNLTELHLQDNQLRGPIPLTFGNLTNLEYLGLGNNANLCLPTALQTWAASRQLVDAQSLPACSPVTGVNIPDANLRAVIADSLGKASGEAITSADMATLTRLDAPNKGISDLTGLEHAINLTGLDLGFAAVGVEFINSNTISDLSPLSNLTNLAGLVLGGNSISDVSALSGITSLTGIDLGHNSISDISALSGLTNMQVLVLGGNRISDISALSGMTSMTVLRLDGNSISSVSALSRMTSLTWLVLDSNRISDVSALSGLTSLQVLSLGDNSISDVSALSGLTNLTHLVLYQNAISDLAPLVANTGLGLGDYVDVRRNPLSNTSVTTHIVALQGRGVVVISGAFKPAVEAKEMPMPRAAIDMFGDDVREKMALFPPGE